MAPRSRMDGRLALPSTTAAMTFLRSLGDPIIDLQLELRIGSAPDAVRRLREAVFATPLITAAFEAQHADGSWGGEDESRRRVLSTLWMTKTLAELGVDDSHPGWHRAVEFLAERSHTASGVLGLDGRDASVLSCYAGIAAELYLRGGRADLARPQIDWIKDYQDVSVSGASRRSRPAQEWDARLRTRYGGCLRDTTCLIGLVKTGRALAAWSAREADAEATELAEVIREAYLERRLMYRTNGEIVPIGVYGAEPDRWLLPTYPLDWHTDLIEVLDLVAHTGSPDQRMQPAIDVLMNAQLPDGTWPLRQTFRPRELPAPERRSRSKGSPMVTLRAVVALDACTFAAS